MAAPSVSPSWQRRNAAFRVLRVTNPYLYDRAALQNPAARVIVKKMIAAADALLETETFMQMCIEATTTRQDEIKDLSYDGFTYRQGRPTDEGNYLYSVLFVMMDRRAGGESALALRGLLRAHPSMWTFLDCNETKLYEFQGDLIECILHQARVTGSAIADYERPDRNKARRAIVVFANGWNELMRYLNRMYVPVSYRPPTLNLVDEMLYALHSIDPLGEHSAVLARPFQRFEQLAFGYPISE